MKKSLKQLNKAFESLSELDRLELNEAILKGDYTILDRKPEFKELIIKVLEIAIWLPFTGKGTDLALSFLVALLKGTENLKHNINN